MLTLADYQRLRARALDEIYRPAHVEFQASMSALVRFAQEKRDLEDDYNICELLGLFARIYAAINLMQACAQSFSRFFVLNFKVRDNRNFKSLEASFQQMVVDNLHIYEDPATEVKLVMEEFLTKNPGDARVLSDYFFQVDPDKGAAVGCPVLAEVMMMRGVLFACSSDEKNGGLVRVADDNARHFTKATLLADVSYSFLSVLKCRATTQSWIDASGEEKVEVQFGGGEHASSEADYVRRHGAALQLALLKSDMGRFINATLDRMDPATGRYKTEDMETPKFMTVDLRGRALPFTLQEVSKSDRQRQQSNSKLFDGGVVCFSTSRKVFYAAVFTEHHQHELARSPEIGALKKNLRRGSPSARSRRRSLRALDSPFSHRSPASSPRSVGRTPRRRSTPAGTFTSPLARRRYMNAETSTVGAPVPTIVKAPMPLWKKALIGFGCVVLVAAAFVVPYVFVGAAIGAACASGVFVTGAGAGVGVSYVKKKKQKKQEAAEQQQAAEAQAKEVAFQKAAESLLLHQAPSAYVRDVAKSLVNELGGVPTRRFTVTVDPTPDDGDDDTFNFYGDEAETPPVTPASTAASTPLSTTRELPPAKASQQPGSELPPEAPRQSQRKLLLQGPPAVTRSSAANIRRLLGVGGR